MFKNLIYSSLPNFVEWFLAIILVTKCRSHMGFSALCYRPFSSSRVIWNKPFHKIRQRTAGRTFGLSTLTTSTVLTTRWQPCILCLDNYVPAFYNLLECMWVYINRQYVGPYTRESKVLHMWNLCAIQYLGFVARKLVETLWHHRILYKFYLL